MSCAQDRHEASLNLGLRKARAVIGILHELKVSGIPKFQPPFPDPFPKRPGDADLYMLSFNTVHRFPFETGDDCKIWSRGAAPEFPVGQGGALDLLSFSSRLGDLCWVCDWLAVAPDSFGPSFIRFRSCSLSLCGIHMVVSSSGGGS